jgi:hypothetical protein
MDGCTIAQKGQTKYLDKLEEVGLVLLVDIPQSAFNGAQQNSLQQRRHTHTSHINLGNSTTASGIFLQWTKLAIAISTVALFDFWMSRFIVDIILWEKKANEFCLLPLTEVEVLVPANADEKGLSDKGDKAELLTTTPCFFSSFPTADSCCNAMDS